MAVSKGVRPQRELVFRPIDYWAPFQREMAEKRERALEKLRASSTLRRVVLLIYDYPSMSFQRLLADPTLVRRHKLSGDQLANRIADLRELWLVEPHEHHLSREQYWSMTLFGKSLIAARERSIRAGKF